MSSTEPSSLPAAIIAGEAAQERLSDALDKARAAVNASVNSSVSPPVSSTAASSNLLPPVAASFNLPPPASSTATGTPKPLLSSVKNRPMPRSTPSLGRQEPVGMNPDKADELREANKNLPPGWHAEFNGIGQIRWVDASNPPNVIEYQAKPDENGVLPDYAKTGFNRFRGGRCTQRKKRSRKGQKKTRTSGKVKI